MDNDAWLGWHCALPASLSPTQEFPTSHSGGWDPINPPPRSAAADF